MDSGSQTIRTLNMLLRDPAVAFTFFELAERRPEIKPAGFILPENESELCQRAAAVIVSAEKRSFGANASNSLSKRISVLRVSGWDAAEAMR